MQLRLASIAERDIRDYALWLDQKQNGLGHDFVLAVEATLADIRRMPRACPGLHLADFSVDFELRWLTVGRFPYKVVFQLTHDEIFVLGVLHPHRDLDAILRSRLGA